MPAFLRRAGRLLMIAGKLARATCRDRCCGAARYYRFRACCDPSLVIWVRTTNTCANGGPLAVVSYDGVCYAGDGTPPKTAQQILTENPLAIIEDRPGGWLCAQTCFDQEVCEQCPICCVVGYLPPYECGGGRDGVCVECGNRFTVTITAQATNALRGKFRRVVVSAGTPQDPCGYPYQCVFESAEVPIDIHEVNVQITLTFQCGTDEIGNPVMRVGCTNAFYQATRTFYTYDVPQCFGDGDPVPVLDVQTQTAIGTCSNSLDAFAGLLSPVLCAIDLDTIGDILTTAAVDFIPLFDLDAGVPVNIPVLWRQGPFEEYDDQGNLIRTQYPRSCSGSVSYLQPGQNLGPECDPYFVGAYDHIEWSGSNGPNGGTRTESRQTYTIGQFPGLNPTQIRDYTLQASWTVNRNEEPCPIGPQCPPNPTAYPAPARGPEYRPPSTGPGTGQLLRSLLGAA